MSLTAWLLAAVFTAAMILCFAEVASRFNVAGGAYLFTQAAFGRYVGLQIGWLAYVSRTTAAAAQASLFATYLAEFIPGRGLGSARLLSRRSSSGFSLVSTCAACCPVHS